MLSVLRPTQHFLIVEYVKQLRLERNCMNINNVVRPVLIPVPSKGMKTHTGEKPYEYKQCVRLLLTLLSCKCIREHTLERSTVDAKNLVRLPLTPLLFDGIKKLTLEKLHKFKPCFYGR